MKMDSTSSDHSPPLSENPSDHWMTSWENDDSSISGLNLVGSAGFSDLVEDKEVAARAVAFVVNSTRKGIVPLCADVANLLRSKKALEKKVSRLKCENDSLRSSRAGSVQTSHSASPPASVNSAYSDPRPHDRSSRPCSRCSSHCSSLASSNSPKLDKNRRQRSPPFSFPGYRRSSGEQGQGHQVVVTALVHPNPGDEVKTSPGGGSPQGSNHGHQRKGSLPQMVSEPEAGLPKVSPQSQRVSVSVQCDPVEDQAARLKETLSINSQLSEDLLAAHKQIEQLKSSLKELEMKQLAHQCLEEYEAECQESVERNSAVTTELPLILPVLQRSDSMRSSRSSLRRTSSPILIPSPLDGCRCSQCKDQPATRSTLVIPPKNGLSNDVRARLQLEEGDHVVVRGERTGHVCYIGHLDNITPADAIFVGLQLDAPVGHHDGAVNGHRYYQCTKDHGAFVPLQDILCIIAKKSTKSPQPYEKVSLTIEMEKRPREPSGDLKSEKIFTVTNCRDHKRYPYTDPLLMPADSGELV